MQRERRYGVSNQYFGDDRIVHESIDISKASSRRIYSNSEASDDIVTRLREGHGQGCQCYARCYCECGCDAIWAEHYTEEATKEIERLRKCLQHAIDHIGKWQLFTTEEKQALIAEYEQAVRGE
jgi:hypothetical protein